MADVVSTYARPALSQEPDEDDANLFFMEPREALVADLEDLIVRSGAETVCVGFHDLADGREVFLRPDERLHPASTIKLAILAEVFHQEKQDKLSLTDRIPITDTFRSSIDGSPYTLSPEDDGDQTLYSRLGQEETVRELARLMIVRSGNLATNLLMDLVTAEAVNAYMRELGAGDLYLRNYMMDMKAFNLGKTNLGTVRSLCRLLTCLATKDLVLPSSSDEMIRILLGQEFNEGIPAGLPPSVSVAHKTGSISNIYHDAGIVYPQGRAPYILAVMTRGIAEQEKAQALVAAISSRVYAARA